MIHLKIQQSPQKHFINEEYLFYFSQLTIGRSIKNHIVLDDQSVRQRDLILNFESGGVLITHIHSDFFLVNDKKISGKKSLKVGDTFQCGETRFLILNYNFESINKTLDFESHYQDILQNHPERISLLAALNSELEKEAWLD